MKEATTMTNPTSGGRHRVALSSLFLAVACAVGLGSANAAEAPLTGTLKTIKDNGVVVIGFRDASIPFSYYDSNQQPIGYSMDFSNLIIDKLKQDLKMPNLKVRKIPITSQNRIALLQNGTFDFECTTTTNNEAREKQVDFSDSFFEIGTRLLTLKNSGIKDFADLKGQTVVVGAGTTSEKILRRMNVEKKMGMHIISAKDHTESSLMLKTGRAKAMMMDDALLAGERAKMKTPSDYVITGTPQSHEVYGCMTRKNDEGLKKLIDGVVSKAETSGEAVRIYKKWFMSPIPPKGLNLDFPMSDDMKALFAHPSDKPVS